MYFLMDLKRIFVSHNSHDIFRIWVENESQMWVTHTSFPGYASSATGGNTLRNCHDTTDGEGCSVADIDGDFDLDYIWSSINASFIFINNNFNYTLISTESRGKLSLW